MAFCSSQNVFETSPTKEYRERDYPPALTSFPPVGGGGRSKKKGKGKQKSEERGGKSGGRKDEVKKEEGEWIYER